MCTFETDMCNWQTVIQPPTTSRRYRRDPSDNQYVWTRVQGSSVVTGDFRPKVDQTSKSATGFYLTADSSFGQFRSVAEIKSPLITQTGPQCTLEFWWVHFCFLQQNKMILSPLVLNFNMVMTTCCVLQSTMDMNISDCWQVPHERPVGRIPARDERFQDRHGKAADLVG